MPAGEKREAMRLVIPQVLAAILAVASAGWVGADDRQTAEMIAGKMRTSGQLRSYEIRVKVEKGTAWLRGRVASRQQMDTAVSLVQQTGGVKRVVNGLTIWIDPARGPEMVPTPLPPVSATVERAWHIPEPPRSAPTFELPTKTLPPELVAPLVPEPDPPVNGGEAGEAKGKTDPSGKIGESQPDRRQGLAWDLERLPFTVQRTCFRSAADPMPAAGLRIAATFAAAGEPVLVPDDYGLSAGEAYAGDGGCDPPGFLNGAHEAQFLSGGLANTPALQP
ncbi:MAG: BON domain-containing protein [Thermoguttaceae bacterium]